MSSTGLQLVIPPRPTPPPVVIDGLQRALDAATDPAEIKDIEDKLNAIEQYMKNTGLYSFEEMFPVNAAKVRARWKLGQALAKVERSAGPGRGKKEKKESTFTSFLQRLGLLKPTAVEAQRIGAMPELELTKACAQAQAERRPVYYGELVKLARPYWYKESRSSKHRQIAKDAKPSSLNKHATFPLVYADPPWRFDIYSEKGAERTPDQHYPTLSIDDIKAFAIDGRPVDKVAHKDAALLLWCTSSNMHLALEVMKAWGFTFKSSAVWVKTTQPDDGDVLTRFGLGLVFRNMHEILLYGTRGKMPGPQYQPPSVFFYPRGEHSAKPEEIRAEIEKMYPDFDDTTRLELFARSAPSGWSTYGFEA